jgi:hypothetical protein
VTVHLMCHHNTSACIGKTAGLGVNSVYRSGAPRSMKMGTTASPWRYDAGASHALHPTNLRGPAILHFAPIGAIPVFHSHSSGASENRDRPQCDIAHQSDLGHIPTVGERFRNERELTPAQIGLRRRLVHP